MPMLEFVGQSARDADNVQADPSRLINCYREPLMGGRSKYALKSVLGETEFLNFPEVFVRALETVDGDGYAVAGGDFYSFGSDGSFVRLGGGVYGNATITGNNSYACFASGGEYWVWDGSTLSQPTIPLTSFSVGSIDTISNYTVVTEAGGRRFLWSDVADPTTLPALNFSTADGKDDLCIRCMAIGGRLYIFKERSFEVWYVTGDTGANAFARTVGGVIDVGLAGHDQICRVENGAFFIGSDGKAYLTGDGQRSAVSTPAVNTAIAQGEVASCFTFEDEGHSFCAISFRDRPAWIYDLATQEWHERAEGQNLDPWTARVSVYAYGAWTVGRDDGGLSQLGRTNADRDEPMVREATSRTLYVEGTRFTAWEIEFYPKKGRSNGTISLFLSPDEGETWGRERTTGIGPVGNYGRRCKFGPLGQFDSLTARVRWSDPYDTGLETSARVRI